MLAPAVSEEIGLSGANFTFSFETISAILVSGAAVSSSQVSARSDRTCAQTISEIACAVTRYEPEVLAN
jgi:hypothetical protein